MINTVEKLTVDGSGAQLPSARFITNPTSGALPLLVSFDASTSSDANGVITRYDWDFGDGATGSGVTTTHTYTAAGTYTVVLTVTDNDGATDTETEVITVTDPSVLAIVFQDGVTPTNAYEGTRDTKIKSDAQDMNFGSNTRLEVDGSPDYAALLKWDLSSLPTGSTVLSAEVTIEVVNASPDSYEIYEMKQDWIEEEATWKQYRNGGLWQMEGASGEQDRGTDVVGMAEGASTGALTFSLSETGVALVEAWINNPSVNRGLILQDYTDASNGIDFRSREINMPSHRPRLALTYLPGTAVSREADEAPPGLSGFAIESIYPNPFNSRTTMRVALVKRGVYQVRVYNALGQLVYQTEFEARSPGFYTVGLSLTPFTSGVYFVHVRHRPSGAAVTGKMLLVK